MGGRSIQDQNGMNSAAVVGDALKVTSGPAEDTICSKLSSSSLLLSGGVLTTDSVDVSGYSIVIVSVYSSHASATNGLSIQFSTDNVSWDFKDEFTIPALIGKTFSFQTVAQYMRIVYSNGGTTQTEFRLQTILKPVYSKPSSHKIGESISDQDDAELVKAVMSGQKNGDGFINFEATQRGSFPVALQEYQGDAFGRLRVSEPFTIFDNSLTHPDSDSLYWSELVNGTASSAYERSTSKVTMTVAAISDYIVRQTKQRFKYQPGKSHEVLLTGLLSTESGVRKRVGLCDYDNVNLATISNAPQNGVFFENNGGVLSWNIANNGVITETVTQSNWNFDICDGNGISGFTLDIDDTNIFFLDMEWLGVGAVRCGFVSNSGEIIVCHQFQHASNGFTDVYMRTANLPLSYEVTAVSGTGSLKQICASVISEGGFNPQGNTLSIRNSASQGVTSASKNAILGIRLKAEYFEYSVIPLVIGLLSETGTELNVSLHFNPAYTGTPSWNNLSNSSIQWAEGEFPVTTDGIRQYDAWVSSTAKQSSEAVDTEVDTALRIGKGLNDVLDEIWIVVENIGADDTEIWSSIKFRDLI